MLINRVRAESTTMRMNYFHDKLNVDKNRVSKMLRIDYIN